MAEEVRSDFIGTVVAVHVTAGRVVASGETLVVVESMKMELPVDAPRAGTVLSVAVAEGDSISEGDVLLTLE